MKKSPPELAGSLAYMPIVYNDATFAHLRARYL